MQFHEYQSKAHETATTEDLDVYSLGLLGESGSVASAIKKSKRDAIALKQARRDVSEELGDVLWYLAEIATRFNLDLEAIAGENIKKTEFLFKGKAGQFDAGYPPHEKFPDVIEVSFDGDKATVTLSSDNTSVGDPLTDNAYEEDGYRYHDAFHLAYMTFLGWSPVMRNLMKRKRKSNPEIDNVEDGARARVLEEGISIFIFSQSQQLNCQPSSFSDQSLIPFSLLENIKKMTTTLEVKARSVMEWSEAIASGYQIFDELRKNGKGVVRCDLAKREMTFRRGA